MLRLKPFALAIASDLTKSSLRYAGACVTMAYMEELWSSAGDEPIPARSATVLVAVVPRQSDWAHIVSEHWYHIPLSRAPQRIAADYLAFYHPACFGVTAHSISTFAAVRGYELLPRLALFPDEGAHPRAHDLYYRLLLGPVQTLPWPVRAARLRRITFIRTSWQQLLQAQDVTELWAHETLNTRLSCELCERKVVYRCPGPVAA